MLYGNPYDRRCQEESQQFLGVTIFGGQVLKFSVLLRLSFLSGLIMVDNHY